MPEGRVWAFLDAAPAAPSGPLGWAFRVCGVTGLKLHREAEQLIKANAVAVSWHRFTQRNTVAEDQPMEWTADKDRAVAKLGGGKAAEVVLKRYPGNTSEPIVIELNINITQEVIYRLAGDVQETIDENPEKYFGPLQRRPEPAAPARAGPAAWRSVRRRG